jgi:hypothetical protein
MGQEALNRRHNGELSWSEADDKGNLLWKVDQQLGLPPLRSYTPQTFIQRACISSVLAARHYRHFRPHFDENGERGDEG